MNDLLHIMSHEALFPYGYFVVETVCQHETS